jgi:hypothetical protein
MSGMRTIEPAREAKNGRTDATRLQWNGCRAISEVIARGSTVPGAAVVRRFCMAPRYSRAVFVSVWSMNHSGKLRTTAR